MNEEGHTVVVRWLLWVICRIWCRYIFVYTEISVRYFVCTYLVLICVDFAWDGSLVSNGILCVVPEHMRYTVASLDNSYTARTPAKWAFCCLCKRRAADTAWRNVDEQGTHFAINQTRHRLLLHINHLGLPLAICVSPFAVNVDEVVEWSCCRHWLQ